MCCRIEKNHAGDHTCLVLMKSDDGPKDFQRLATLGRVQKDFWRSVVKESTTKLWHKKEYQVRVYVWSSQLCLWLLYFAKASAFDPRGSECNTSTGRTKRGKVMHAEAKACAESGRMCEAQESHALIGESAQRARNAMGTRGR
ncbi:uncharacterized protein BJ212DRAFT_1299230 [Suillus subaureus]|uniref:Uncharacterized protein n=1 Tax=Suillus subaureus TaxID=48587 RepID=A0A9P7EBH1_9AGAM|nr:uncharacterized protein BJ212DRAFT_1299230 [Suillus subaureus]KAG1817040.1 hypothetical protein BJ212DRAFT_1299230 [Suillus subaureus]